MTRRSLISLACLLSVPSGLLLSAHFILGTEYSQREKQDEGFFSWLMPSYWPIESQRNAARRQRGKDTLQWLPHDAKLRDWLPDTDDLCADQQTLWIRGPPGVGKS